MMEEIMSVMCEVKRVLKIKTFVYHASSDEVMDSFLNLSHVNATREVQVSSEQISVSVFFCRPGPGPHSPRAWAGSALVSHPVEVVDHSLVGGKRVFGDHVTHQHHEVLVR